MTYKLLIVDDHPIVRRGLRQLVASESDIEVCGEAADVEEALASIEAERPDIVVIDLSLKSGHGLTLIERIYARDKGIKMLVSSMHDETLYAERALRCGASGYINKQEAPDKIVGAIREVLRGEIYVSEQVSELLLHRLRGGQSLADDPILQLTNRELEIFEMIGQGLSMKQIAHRLDLSQKTVEAHREGIKSKLQLANSLELPGIVIVLRHGTDLETIEAVVRAKTIGHFDVRLFIARHISRCHKRLIHRQSFGVVEIPISGQQIEP